MKILAMIFEADKKGILLPLKMLLVGYYNKAFLSEHVDMLKPVTRAILAGLTYSAGQLLKSQSLFV